MCPHLRVGFNLTYDVVDIRHLYRCIMIQTGALRRQSLSDYYFGLFNSRVFRKRGMSDSIGCIPWGLVAIDRPWIVANNVINIRLDDRQLVFLEQLLDQF